MTQLGQWSREYGKKTEVHLRNVLKGVPSFELGLIQFKQGYLWSMAENPRSESEIEELERIGDVFAFAYDRFLDLQAKEQRVREVEVEAALERVRSQALAMQVSEDLPAVSAAVFREIQSLYPNILNSVIAVVGEDRENTTQWAVLPEGFQEDPETSSWKAEILDGIAVAVEHYDMSELRRTDPFFEKSAIAMKAASPYIHLAKHWTWDLRKRLVERCIERGIWTRKQGREYLRYRRGQGFHMTFVLHDQAYLFTHSEDPLADASIAELKRFAETFDFATKRFLDLQDKERRAREAEIEAALERVRSQALAMETSEDIPAVSASLFRELKALNYKPVTSIIGIPDDERNLTTQWLVVPASFDDPGAWQIVFDDDVTVAIEHFDLRKIRRVHPFYRKHVRAAEDGETSFHTQLFTKRDFAGIVKRQVELGLTPKKQSGDLGSIDTDMYASFVRHAHGYLLFFLLEPPTKSEITELKRFAETFSFAYDRFLDLQDKERRAREAEIEATLERVRAHALSMQKSDDLPSVSAALFRELDGLAFPILSSSIAVLHEDRNWVDQWTTVVPGLEDLAAECGPVYKLDPVVLLEQAKLSDLYTAIPQWKRAHAAWRRTGVTLQKIRFTTQQFEKVLERIVEIGFWTKAYAEAQLEHEVGDVDQFGQWLVFYKHGHL